MLRSSRDADHPHALRPLQLLSPLPFLRWTGLALQDSSSETRSWTGPGGSLASSPVNMLPEIRWVALGLPRP